MSRRSLRYYGPGYLRLAQTFRNGIALARAHHRRSDCDRATFWNGFAIRNAPGRSGLVDTAVEIWGLQVYQFGEFYTPQSNHVVLDLGANIGLFSIWLARRASGIRVLAFEPFAENVTVLKENVQPWLNVHVYPYAVGGHHGTACMRAVGVRSLDHQLEASADGDVVVITLAEAINLAGADTYIDFLKMDIEGSEYDVFAQPQPEDLMRRIDRVAIEWHEHLRPGVLALIKERLSPTHHILSINVEDVRYGMLYAVRSHR